MKILVIEDNASNLKLVTDLLRKQDYVVVEAMDAEKGIQLARDERPDLILMDIQLPGMDGLTATRRLKNWDLTRDIPIIALTAFAMKGDERRILMAGCDDYIAKPIRYKVLLERIETLLSENQAMREADD